MPTFVMLGQRRDVIFFLCLSVWFHLFRIFPPIALPLRLLQVAWSDYDFVGLATLFGQEVKDDVGICLLDGISE